MDLSYYTGCPKKKVEDCKDVSIMSPQDEK